MYIDYLKNDYSNKSEQERLEYINRDKKHLAGIIQERITNDIDCIVDRWYELDDIGYIPENVFADAQMMMAIRVLRVFRVLRLLRASKEIKLIVSVLLRSMFSMFAHIVLFLIFIYLFAIIGVNLFKLPNPENLSGDDKLHYEELMQVAPNSPSNSPDPFGTLHEAMFTLFRELTGEDWTDIRYNHITAYQYGIIKTNPVIITGFHVCWFILSAFLLLNLVTGAIINNYQIVKDEQDHKKEESDLND